MLIPRLVLVFILSATALTVALLFPYHLLKPCPVCVPKVITKTVTKEVKVVEKQKADPVPTEIAVVVEQKKATTPKAGPPPVRFWHESSTQFNDNDVAEYVAKYGKNILIGGDPGHGTDFEEAMRAVDRHGALKHVYLVGPGMMSWSQEERDQIRSHARSVGIDTSKTGWHDLWFDWGWKRKQEKEFVYFDKKGFYSGEIDNVDGPIDQENVAKYVAYVKELFKFFEANKLKIKLAVKNLSEDQLKGLEDAGLGCHKYLAPYGLFEKGSGNPKEQIRLAAKLCVKAVTPINGLRDTHNYGTTRAGIPGLQTK